MKTLCLLAAFFCSLVGAVPGAAAQTDYIIGPQDVVTVTVFGEPDLSRDYKVEHDGTIGFPLIGRVQAGGQTLRMLERELTKRLSDGFLRNPEVSAAVQQYKSQQILIIGEVRNPGPYPLSGGMTLLQALAIAGSTTPMAGREALIARTSKTRKDAGQGGDDAEIIRVDLAALQAGNFGINVALQDGDTVNVPKARSVFVSGQVKNPGAFSVDDGTTVLQVLSLAGGITDRGSDGRIVIERIVKGKRAQVKAKLADVVQPGDTIIVKERFF